VELSEVGALFRENKSGYYCTGDLPGSVTEVLIIEFISSKPVVRSM
jgi:hypothetical protein